MLKSAVWFVTMACNFKCKYCWEVQAQEKSGDFKPEKFKKPEEWIEAWSRLRPGILDITGGEPFLQPGLIDIIEAISANGTRLAMTSNFSHPILEFVKRVNPNQLFSITASYHPSENGTKTNPMNIDVFLGRMLLLREYNFNVTINIVTWPEQIWLIPKWIELFQNVHKFKVHIDPYTSIEYYPWEYTEAQQRFLSRYVTGNRVINPTPTGPVLCTGGIDHLNVQPDGSAWRCILERQQFQNQVGNIFDPNFTLLPEMKRCDQQHVCPGCDRDKVTVYKINS